MTIPIRNLYYLLLYAYDALDEWDVVEAGELPEARIADLFAHVLDTGANHLLRRGIDRGYVPHREAIPGVRGRIDIAATVKSNTLAGARAVCEFDEFTADVPHNRILRATVRRLMRVPDLAPPLHDRLAALYLRLGGITDIRLTAAAFRAVQLHRNNRFYRFLLAVCRMIHEHLLVDESSGETQFRDFVRDERRMRRLFERFVRNFYRREQSAFKVKRSKFPWVASGETELLPGMNTDVTLAGQGRVIVVETKYTASQFQEHFGSKSIRSEHLYQLFAYLANMQKKLPGDKRAEAILLYPRAGAGPSFRCEVHGHPLTVTTVDLSARWENIRENLLTLTQPR